MTLLQNNQSEMSRNMLNLAFADNHIQLVTKIECMIKI
jgi:hypothetical protein